MPNQSAQTLTAHSIGMAKFKKPNWFIEKPIGYKLMFL